MEKTNLNEEDVETIGNILGKPYNERIEKELGFRGLRACVSRLELGGIVDEKLATDIRNRFYDLKYISGQQNH
jgi:hypothetical protein